MMSEELVEGKVPPPFYEPVYEEAGPDPDEWALAVISRGLLLKPAPDWLLGFICSGCMSVGCTCPLTIMLDVVEEGGEGC